jgi:PAS domain S-box-containing protein
MSELRKTGIDVLGDIPWGSHFCNFYETKQDLLDTLVPYFKAGLESKEFCLWVVSNSELITVEEARDALKQAVPDLDGHLSDGDIEIVNRLDWYLEENVFNLERMTREWDAKLKRALVLGYDGMRVSGDTFWLEGKDWKDFYDYENQLNDFITELPMTVLCTYPLAKSEAFDILDVVHAHQFAIARRQGEWEVIETTELIQAKAEIKKLNEELERRVAERTQELTLANEKLKYEIAEPRKAEVLIIKEKELSNEIIDSIPGVSVLLDEDLKFIRWNKHFEVISGYNAEEIPLLHALNDFYDEEDKKKKVEILQQIYTKGMSTYELGVRMKDGRKVSFYFNSRLINYGGKRCIICTGVDITERKKFEEDLQRSESRYRTLIEQASDAIIITDECGHLIEVNKSFCKMVGYAEKELIGIDITTLIDPEHLKTDPLRFDLLLEGKSLFGERLMKKRDGTVFPIEVHAKMLSDKRILAIVRDITDRRQAEDALRRSEDRIRLIIDTIPTMAWSLQPDGTVDFVNQRWLDYTGEGEIERRTRIIHPEDLSRVMEKWLVNKTAGKAFDNEIRLRRADGEYHWFLVRTAPLRDEQGNLVKWYGVSIDIEDSKRAEDELHLAYQRLSFQVENTPLAIIEFDKDLFIKRWSKRAEEIFGWKESEALGKNVYDPHFPIIYKEDIPAVNKINEQLMKGMVNRNLSLNRNNTRDGNVIYSEWYNSVLRDEHGNMITILSLVHDVTERKKAEEELQQMNEELHSLSSHLQNVREEERIQIARNIHDDLGQQLTGLKMDVNWLNKKLGVKDEIVKQKMISMLELIDETLKSVRRISSDLRPSILDDFGLIAALEWHSEEVAKRSEIKVNFSTDIPEPDIPVTLATGIFRIYQELLTNALRHANAHVITSSLRLKDNHLMLTVKDDGQGMDPEITGTKTLGLIGIKERTFALGGKYDLKSERGKGTGVQVSIPYENNLNKP